ncbi:MAG TPA: AAA family ATPase, partial [Fluviicola sp.]|nr:AAA family ATPase [Fluviicola sp.]
MLRSLSVRNFALIEQVTIDFENGLHVITGETGSGKSILLGALNLILGDRADYSVIRDPEQKTVVEAVFSLQQDNKCWFDKNDVDFEHETIIRREIATQGKSRAFINDTPVQLTQLKDFVERLIYIHSQHETLEIRKPSFQFELIDAFTGNSKVAEQVALNHSLLLKLNAEKQRIEQASLNAEKEKDYLQFQLNELELLNLDSIQYAELESHFEKISQVEELKTCYNAISN